MPAASWQSAGAVRVRHAIDEQDRIPDADGGQHPDPSEGQTGAIDVHVEPHSIQPGSLSSKIYIISL